MLDARNNIRVLHVGTFYQSGGAAIAMNRLNEALKRYSVQSSITSTDAYKYKDKAQTYASPTKIFLRKIKVKFVKRLCKFFFSEEFLSLNFFKNRALVKFINNSDFDVVHLHWIHNEMLSLSDISSINKPIVWTLHDEWLVTAPFHYELNLDRNRSYISSYLLAKYKKYAFRCINELEIIFIAPSEWLTVQAKRKYPSKNIIKIHNTVPKVDIDLNIQQLKSKHKIETKDVLIFGCDTIKDYRKGFDLLIQALQKIDVTHTNLDLTCITFGANLPTISGFRQIKFKHFGTINDFSLLCELYKLSNAFVIPSRRDNLPNTAVEAIMNNTPVIGFQVGGIPEIAESTGNSYLSPEVSVDGLIHGMEKVLGFDLSNNGDSYCYQKFQNHFEEKTVVRDYLNAYEQALSQANTQ